MMKAAVLYGPGGPEKFVIEDRDVPVAKAGWVVIKVRAFGLNRSELMTRKGMSPDVRFPRVLGIECAGEVENDPSGEFKPGQKVLACMGGMGRDFDGSYSDYTLLPKALLSPFTSTLPWQQLGAIPEMFQTVYGSLHQALNIQSGETILIRGGTSSIGLLAAQVAAKIGLTVVATTRNPDKAPLLTANRAAYVVVDNGHIAQNVKDIFPGGVNKVLELVGTSTLKDSLQCAARGGKVCMTGMLAEQWSIPEFAPMDFIPATVSLTVYDSGQVKADMGSLQDFISSVEKGEIKLGIGRVFQLSEIAAAHQLMDSNLAGGKIVVLP